MLARIFIIIFLLIPITLLAAPDGPHSRDVYLPFKKELINYSSWIEDFNGLYIRFDLQKINATKIICTLDNVFSGRILYPTQGIEKWMEFSGNKTFIFSTQISKQNEYPIDKKGRIIIYDDAPKKWKSYGTCQYGY